MKTRVSVVAILAWLPSRYKGAAHKQDLQGALTVEYLGWSTYVTHTHLGRHMVPPTYRSPSELLHEREKSA